MALNDILGSALSGLSAAQAGLRTVSTNIANVGTPGYARERVNQSPLVTAGRVSGVAVGEPVRVADRFLEATVYRRATDVGAAEVRSDYLDRLQALFGAPGADGSLSARLDAVSSAAISVTGVGRSTETAADLIARTGDAIGALQQMDRDIAALTGDADSELGFTVERVNSLLKQIHELNDAVSRLDGLGRSSAGSVDRRNAAVEELSSLMAVEVREQPDGRVAIDTVGGAPLLDRRLRLLSYPNGGVTAGSAQPVHATISIRFADSAGEPAAATGDRIESAAVGGKLGGLIDLRDRALPQMREAIGALFGGLARSLNAASNAASAVPAPATLTGAQTPLAATDRLGFTGRSVFAVTASDGTLVAKTTVDFDALGPGATVADAVAAINAGLGGAATAGFTNGRLEISATVSGQGVVVADDAASPARRGGVGFAHWFGLNDLVRSDAGMNVSAGFASGDPHGFAAGQTVAIELRDGSGRVLGSAELAPAAGGTMGDLLADLNAGPLASYGSFRLDELGRFRFDADPAYAGAALSIPVDSTARADTGVSFTALSGLTGEGSGLGSALVRPELAGDATRLPLARFDAAAAVGGPAIGKADTRGAQSYADAFATAIDLGKDGTVSLERFASSLLGKAGSEAANATDRYTAAAARRDDAVNRRDSFSGVNLDEELGQMVVLQNSYSAAARVMTTASEMYDTLIAMMR